MTTENRTQIRRPVDEEPTTLVIRNRNAGFFSNFNAVVDNLARRLGRDGVEAVRVEWSVPERSTHFPYGTADDGNLWCAFFEPLPFHIFPSNTVETNTFANFAVTSRNAYAAYKVNRRWRQNYHRVYARYVKPRRRLIDQVERIYRDRMEGHKCVGVHHRHSEHDIENLFRIPDPDAFIARVNRLLPSDRSWRVFLAADNEAAVTAFEAAFGQNLVVQPGVARAQSTSDMPVYMDNEDPNTSLGDEVLIDCLLLARCDVLVHTTSNLATTAGYINPDLKMIYCEPTHQAVIGYLWATGKTVRFLLGHAYRTFVARVGAAE